VVNKSTPYTQLEFEDGLTKELIAKGQIWNWLFSFGGSLVKIHSQKHAMNIYGLVLLQAKRKEWVKNIEQISVSGCT